MIVTTFKNRLRRVIGDTLRLFGEVFKTDILKLLEMKISFIFSLTYAIPVNGGGKGPINNIFLFYLLLEIVTVYFSLNPRLTFDLHPF